MASAGQAAEGATGEEEGKKRGESKTEMSTPADPIKRKNDKGRLFAQSHPEKAVGYALNDVDRLKRWAALDPKTFPDAVDLGNRLQGVILDGLRYVSRTDDFNPLEIRALAAANLGSYRTDQAVVLSGKWEPKRKRTSSPNRRFKQRLRRMKQLKVPPELIGAVKKRGPGASLDELFELERTFNPAKKKEPVRTLEEWSIPSPPDPDLQTLFSLPPKTVMNLPKPLMGGILIQGLQLLLDQKYFVPHEWGPAAVPIPVFDRHKRKWIPNPNPCAWILEALAGAAVNEDGLSALAEVMPVDRETRDDPILPAFSVVTKPDYQQSNLFTATETKTGGQLDLLPGYGPGRAGGPLVPALLLALYDHLGEGKQLSPGSGAPLALRIFVEMCLSVPLEERNRPDPVLFKSQRFGDFLRTQYSDPSFYRPSRHYGPIREALEFLTLPEARVPWVDPTTGDSAARLVVVPLDIPHDGSLNDWIQFQVHLPPGSHRGAIVDRPALRIAGVKSARMYRLALSLAFWWCTPGRLRIPFPKGRGRGGEIWRQVRSPERYPEVTDAELNAMTHPRHSDGNNRMQFMRARETLSDLVKIGYAAVHPKQRILPGPQWAGWNNSG